MPVDVSAVRGFSDLRAFVALPFRLHAGTPWIPPLKLERYAFLSRKLNPFFTHGEAELFLARRDGQIVGRASAQVDFAYNQYHGTRWGMFGFLEFEEDPEILDVLLAAAAAWLRAHGCDRMVGPMDFQLNDEAGIVIDGFDREPLIRQPWHPPYYQRLCEAAGLTKVMDLLTYDLSIDNRAELNPIIPRIAQRSYDRYGITIRKMERRHLRSEMDEFATVYNAAWSGNWGFVPYSKADLDAYTIDMQLIYARDWFMVAEADGQTIAMAITIPDINQVLKRMRGRLLPLGWCYYLNRGRIIDRLRVGFLGVLPEYQHTGVAAALYMEHFAAAERGRQQYGEAGVILETNSSMNRGLEAMGARVVKRYRVYERMLDDAARGAFDG